MLSLFLELENVFDGAEASGDDKSRVQVLEDDGFALLLLLWSRLLERREQAADVVQRSALLNDLWEQEKVACPDGPQLGEQVRH